MDAADFTEFYAAAFQPLVVQLYAYTGDLADAQDVVQEAFCRALSRWQRIARYDDPAAWVRRVAWNLAMSRWRRFRTAVVAARKLQPDPVPGPNPDRVAIVAALAALPPRMRQVAVLYYLADLPIAGIANELGLSTGGVKAALHRARSALAELLAEDPAGDPAPEGADV